MVDLANKRSTCRTCGSANIELVYPLAATPPGDHYVAAGRLNEEQPLFGMDLHLCLDCGLVQLVHVIDPEHLYREYIYQTSISLGLAEHFGRYVDTVLQKTRPPKDGLVVDIGSNDGTFLGFFKKAGLRVLGVEPARAIAAAASEKGVESWPEFFTPDLADKIVAEKGRAAIVTANNVFANIDDLGQVAQGLSRLLAKDGVFVCETGYLGALVDNDIIDNVYHEHLSYFSVAPLDNYFRKYGMELIDVDFSDSKGGSIRVTAQLAGGGRERRPIVQEALAEEKRRGYADPATYKAFAGRMAEIKKTLLDYLARAKAKGESIAGYGASVGVTTLLYEFGLAGYLDYLLDDNPARHGLYSPGHHLPVLDSAEVYQKRPDQVLILAWRYAEPIMKRHGRYLAEGGRFIRMLPAFKVEKG